MKLSSEQKHRLLELQTELNIKSGKGRYIVTILEDPADKPIVTIHFFPKHYESRPSVRAFDNFIDVENELKTLLI